MRSAVHRLRPPRTPPPSRVRRRRRRRQTWCRGKKHWESEAVCLDCMQYSFRGYRDPDFQTPEEFEKARWTALVAEQAARGDA